MSAPFRAGLFVVSALLLLTGTLFYITGWLLSPYLFAVGAAGLTLIYATEPQEESDIRKKRLQRFNLIAGVLMIGASMLMFNDRNEWMLCLTIAAILQLYVAFVYPKSDHKAE
jgi:uncharacterized membrane protein